MPLGVEVAVVPGHVLVHHGSRGRMRGDVLDLAFADDPDLAPVAQRVAVLSAGARHYAAFTSRIARQMRSLVAGMSSSRTPSGSSACMIVFITAGIAPTQPASPAPLAPSGLPSVGTGFDTMRMLHMLSARGMQ